MKKAAEIVFVLALLALTLGGCGGGEEFIDYNYPYEPDTPRPAPHEGIFVSPHGTMTFNGDGESVVIDFDEALTENLNLPAGRQNATYEFLSGDLPPHGHVEIRYDVAMAFALTVGEGDAAVYAMTDIGMYEDGHFYSGTNCTTEDRITFFVNWLDDGNREAVDFLKTGGASDEGGE